MQPVIVVHGGAWAIPDDRVQCNLSGVKCAARRGYSGSKNELYKGPTDGLSSKLTSRTLTEGNSCVDAVVAAVATLEDDENFDAGRGSVLNIDGEIEMHAMVMRGIDMNCGGVVAVPNIKNPVKLARIVMEKSDHCILDAKASLKLAKEYGIEEEDIEYFKTETNQIELEKMKKYNSTIANFFKNELVHDTVGAVAVDKFGNVACATSTGGITAQAPGRVSDSPCPGAGGFADNDSVAVSTTGHGEAILKVSLARMISMFVGQGMDLSVASNQAFEYMRTKTNGYGGAIVVNKNGKVAVKFNTKRMPWAVCGTQPDVLNQKTIEVENTKNIFYGIDPDNQFIEML